MLLVCEELNLLGGNMFALDGCKLPSNASKNPQDEVWEGNAFGVRVTPQGNKSFVFMYRYQGKLKRMTLGNYPAMSLAEAHKAHAEAKEMLTRGIDPGAKALTEKKEERSAPTIAALANNTLRSGPRPANAPGPLTSAL